MNIDLVLIYSSQELFPTGEYCQEFTDELMLVGHSAPEVLDLRIPNSSIGWSFAKDAFFELVPI
jgi:hypothetical protein